MNKILIPLIAVLLCFTNVEAGEAYDRSRKEFSDVQDALITLGAVLTESDETLKEKLKLAKTDKERHSATMEFCDSVGQEMESFNKISKLFTGHFSDNKKAELKNAYNASKGTNALNEKMGEAERKFEVLFREGMALLVQAKTRYSQALMPNLEYLEILERKIKRSGEQK